MKYSHVVVIDQGTHSTRAIIYNQAGDSVFKVQQSIELFYSEKYHVEQDAQQILNSCRYVIEKSKEYIDGNRLHKVAFALTTQRSTVVAWDLHSGAALAPALSWLDTRAQSYLHSLKLNDKQVKSKTGLPISAHYGASKLNWLLQNNSSVKKAKQEGNLLLGPLSSFLIFNLLEKKPCFVDYANAHRTLLWNLKTRNWDQSLMQEFDIDVTLLPKCVPNIFAYGKLCDSSFPLILANGDQNSAVCGYGKLEKNTIFVNIGTGGFVLAAGQKTPVLDSRLLASITYSTNATQEYAMEGTINGAGAALTWAEDAWKINNIGNVSWHDVMDVPIFLNSVGGLGSPYWVSDLHPKFIDKNKSYSSYTHEQCKAAIMESIVFLIAININEMQKHGINANKLIVAGGLSTDKNLCQRIADLCEVPVVASSFKEATSRGAAWLSLEQPNWEPVDIISFAPKKDKNIIARYNSFKMEIERLVH